MLLSALPLNFLPRTRPVFGPRRPVRCAPWAEGKKQTRNQHTPHHEPKSPAEVPVLLWVGGGKPFEQRATSPPHTLLRHCHLSVDMYPIPPPPPYLPSSPVPLPHLLSCAARPSRLPHGHVSSSVGWVRVRFTSNKRSGSLSLHLPRTEQTTDVPCRGFFIFILVFRQ